MGLTFGPIALAASVARTATTNDHAPDDAAYQYALFRDGLALMVDPYRGHPLGVVMWSPTDGVSAS
jgi:hypothetical protein